MALFVPLDVGYPDHPKIIRAGLEGAAIHTFALCAAKRLESDGWIDRTILIRFGASDDLLAKLISLDLLEADGELVRPVGWHDRNPTQDAIDSVRAQKSAGSKRGNHERWNHPGLVEDCPKCVKKPQVVAPCDPIGLPSDSHRTPHATPQGSPKTESETETKSPPPESQDYSQPPSPEPVEPVVVDQQMVRRCAAAIGRTLATGASDPAAYAASVTRRMLTGDDPADRDEITRRLTAGETVEAVVATWTPTDPLTGDRPSSYVAPPAAGPALKPWTTPVYDEPPLPPAEVAAAAAAARAALPKHRVTA